jgi:hypothetical protein
MYKRICATNTIYKHTTNTVLLYNNNNKNIYCTTNTIYNRRANNTYKQTRQHKDNKYFS